MRAISSFIYHKILGWKMIGHFNDKTIKKCVIVAQLAKIKISFVAKKELFKGPMGWYFKKVGGVPIDRTPGQNKVEAIANIFKEREELRITIAPEGTRKKVKTGFYHIAKAANVPIIMITFDFGKKQNLISEPFYPTDNMEKDLQFMYDFFKGVKGKVPEYSFDVD